MKDIDVVFTHVAFVRNWKSIDFYSRYAGMEVVPQASLIFRRGT